MLPRLCGRLAALVLPLVAVLATPSGPAVGAADDRQVTELRMIMRQLLAHGAIGATGEVSAGGRTVRLVMGRSQLDPNRPARPDARFRAGSVTKLLTAVLALQQVQEGRWTLDTTIGDVLPGLWSGRDDVTLRQLLSHTSGMPDVLRVLMRGADSSGKFLRVISKKRTDAGLVRRAKGTEWLFEPGTGFSYSNTGFVVVGMMLERQTGKSMRALVRRDVLRPARMTDSAYAVGRQIAAPRLREYARIAGRTIDLRSFSPTMFSAAGALVSTARDLNRFQLALARGVLLRKPLVRLMHRVAVPDRAAGVEYGLGSYRMPDPCPDGGDWLHGHDGATWGTLTMSFANGPRAERRVSIAVTGRPYTAKRMEKLFELMTGFVYTGATLGCVDGRMPAERPTPDFGQRLRLPGR